MKTGVYQIRNILNGKRYIGSSSYHRGFASRWYVHRRHLNRSTHHCAHLQHAWTKHGINAFVFEILLYCDPRDCLMYEQMALDALIPEYNTCHTAGSPIGYRHTNKAKLAIGKASRGRKLSQAGRLKVSLSHRGEGCASAKLSEDDVRFIRDQLANGKTQKSMVEQFCVSYTTIFDIKNRKTWKYI